MICSKAPGKIILFGEHFVVRGFPGIGMAVSSYARACVDSSDRDLVESKQLGLLYDEEKRLGLESSFGAILREIRSLGCRDKIRVLIDSSLFVSSGMGSSAAVSVAVAHALLRFCGLDSSKENVSRIAFEAEKVIHKRPSGIDNTLATYGGVVYYRSGSFRKISVKWPEDYVILIVNTGISRETGAVVKDVLDLYERRREILEHVYRSAESLVEEALKLLERGEFESLGELMNINQGLLYAINTSCPLCEEIIWLLRRNRALGAKLSGAGRGGIAISLYRKRDLDEVLEKLRERGLETLIVGLDERGVRDLLE
ncbi:MAG: mevalonate kinase [Sulfolobales archaeon]